MTETVSAPETDRQTEGNTHADEEAWWGETQQGKRSVFNSVCVTKTDIPSPVSPLIHTRIEVFGFLGVYLER